MKHLGGKALCYRLRYNLSATPNPGSSTGTILLPGTNGQVVLYVPWPKVLRLFVALVRSVLALVRKLANRVKFWVLN